MLRGIPPKNKVGLVLRDRQIEGERDTDKRHTDKQRKDRKILNLSSVNSVVPFCLVDWSMWESYWSVLSRQPATSLAWWLRHLPWKQQTWVWFPAFSLDLFCRYSHTSDLKTGISVATLPCNWCYRVSAGTGWPGVSILWLDQIESLIYNLCLSMASLAVVQADLSLRYTSILLRY